MKRSLRKILTFILLFTMISSVFGIGKNTMMVKADEAVKTASPFYELTGEEMIKEMGAGWNLGNTMDGHTGFTPNETLWQNVTTTKAFIKSVHDAGFNTIRVPVTWGTMIDDDNDYAINEKWISRVQDIVDYAIEQDMYVIINIHHDGAEQSGWLRIATQDKDALYEKFGGVWENIAERFKDYNEHLIFEAMNEVRGEKMSLSEENTVIMDLNQIFVDTVRKTGSNNEKRWLVVCGKYNYIDSLVKPSGGFELPKDTIENRIILSAHCYTTWSFCGSESTSVTTYSNADLINNNEKELSKLEKFTSQGIPVIVGEYGCINKDNSEERAFFLEGMNRLFKKYNLVGVYWDQGWYDRTQQPDYSFSIFDRESCKSIDKNVSDAIIRGFFKAGDCDIASLEHNPEITAIEKLTLADDEISLKIGSTIQIEAKETPEENNDVVLYKTDNPSVATVYNGLIRARGIGETTITAYSLNGEATAQTKIKVTADNIEKCEKISLKEEKYEMVKGEYLYMDAEIVNGYKDAYLTYTSSDENVATVSTIGKIVAVGTGKAKITITCSDGTSAKTEVNVTDNDIVKEIRLALNVYYNDSDKGYYSNEVSGDIITVNTNGQYTLKFDCNTDLSKAAADAGVIDLTNLTAIYIKDQDVTEGKMEKSPLDTCDIMYDKVVVNGTELTINQKSPKSALKKSGIFDTNDPINSWDGSAVDEIKCSNNVANFSTIENPTTIEVTFTLSNMKFTGAEPEEDKILPEETEPDTMVSQTTGEISSDDADENHIAVAVIAVAAVVAAIIAATVIIVLKKKKTK